MGTQTILLMFPWSPSLQRSVEIAESISEIAHWHAPLSLTARRSSLIQNASNIQICPKTLDTSSENRWQTRHRQQLFAPCWRLIILNESTTIKSFIRLWFFTANKWQFVNLTEKPADGDFTAKWQLIFGEKPKNFILPSVTREKLINKVI